ncbi:mandelate racemase/muconate lactonizing enzyme family protein [Cupriavidus taiwanensis]|uniref:mandelate racemase/muconate lactonizing enzyme family protein n=1 Tax=Cupriavidus taiwanensis TaxID=164546 RepID=UPI0039C3A63F
MIFDFKTHEVCTNVDAIVSNISFHSINAAPRSNWMFLKLELADGSAGWGELTLRSHAGVMKALIEELKPSLIGTKLDATVAYRKAYPGMPAGRAGNAVISALDQAARDLASTHLGVPLNALWGSPRSTRLPSYATVNRSIKKRTPEGFAAACKAAVAAGFQGVKVMPLEKVLPTTAPLPAGQEEIAMAITRLEAVREAVGKDVPLMADLHWRLDEESAKGFLEKSKHLNLYWLECPLPESPEWYPSIRRVRVAANEMNVLLAGGENLVGLSGAVPLLQNELYDVLMPDIKYCGGYEEFFRINAEAESRGVQISPHNPSGPIAHAHTVHLCSAVGSSGAIELQFAESPLFEQCVTGESPIFQNGYFVPSSSNGLGISFKESMTADFPPQSVPMSLIDPSFA